MALFDGAREGANVGEVSIGMQRERINPGLSQSEGARSSHGERGGHCSDSAGLGGAVGTPRRLRTMLLAIISRRTTRREMMSAGYLQLNASSGAGSAIEEA